MVKVFEKEIKKALYYAYKTDLSFPRSCGLVSVLISYMIACRDEYLEKYEITCVRGCFKNIGSEDEWCEDYLDDITRYNYKEFECNCHNCNCCDAMVAHSWIELKDKISNETIILDFTSIQFEEDILDYEEEILETTFTEDELFDYLKERSLFIVKESDSRFLQYIPLSTKENAITYVECTKECERCSFSNEIIDFLEYSKLK